jgi:hypothetical protein
MGFKKKSQRRASQIPPNSLSLYVYPFHRCQATARYTRSRGNESKQNRRLGRRACLYIPLSLLDNIGEYTGGGSVIVLGTGGERGQSMDYVASI